MAVFIATTAAGCHACEYYEKMGLFKNLEKELKFLGAKYERFETYDMSTGKTYKLGTKIEAPTFLSEIKSWPNFVVLSEKLYDDILKKKIVKTAEIFKRINIYNFLYKNEKVSIVDMMAKINVDILIDFYKTESGEKDEGIVKNDRKLKPFPRFDFQK